MLATCYDNLTSNPGLPDGCSQAQIDAGSPMPMAFDGLSRTARKQMFLDWVAENHLDVMEMLEPGSWRVSERNRIALKESWESYREQRMTGGK